MGKKIENMDLTQWTNLNANAARGDGEINIPSRGYARFGNGYAAASTLSTNGEKAVNVGDISNSETGPKVFLLSAPRLANVDTARAEVERLATFLQVKDSNLITDEIVKTVQTGTLSARGASTELEATHRSNINTFLKNSDQMIYVDPRIVALQSFAGEIIIPETQAPLTNTDDDENGN